MDSDSALANILEVLVPMVALAILATPVVISALKGRWWLGVIGLVGFVGGFAVAFGMFGIARVPPFAVFGGTLACHALPMTAAGDSTFSDSGPDWRPS